MIWLIVGIVIACFGLFLAIVSPYSDGAEIIACFFLGLTVFGIGNVSFSGTHFTHETTAAYPLSEIGGSYLVIEDTTFNYFVDKPDYVSGSNSRVVESDRNEMVLTVKHTSKWWSLDTTTNFYAFYVNPSDISYAG